MKANFTQSYLASIKATGKVQWLSDPSIPNLRLYVGASGAKTWYVGFREGKGTRYNNHKLGSADALTVKEARVLARDFLASLAKGEEPYNKKIEKKMPLGEFIEKHYGPWVEVNRKTGKATMAILRSSFHNLFKQPIDELKKIELVNCPKRIDLSVTIVESSCKACVTCNRKIWYKIYGRPEGI
jgi:hypothetical protein